MLLKGAARQVKVAMVTKVRRHLSPSVFRWDLGDWAKGQRVKEAAPSGKYSQEGSGLFKYSSKKGKPDRKAARGGMGCGELLRTH